MKSRVVMVSRKELKKILNIKSDKTFFNYVKMGMPHYLVGNKYMFIVDEVLEWWKEMERK